MLHHDFICLDDDSYIVSNSHVNKGLTWAGLGWAFQSGYAANWHPLTWISHMLDCQLFGLNPGGHHLTNLLFHVANTLLLFLWLNQFTGRFVAQRDGGRLVRLASIARRIGGLGR